MHIYSSYSYFEKGCRKKSTQGQGQQDQKEVQWNPINTDTKGTCQSVRIIGVSILHGISRTHVLSKQRLRQTDIAKKNLALIGLRLLQVQTMETLWSLIILS